MPELIFVELSMKSGLDPELKRLFEAELLGYQTQQMGYGFAIQNYTAVPAPQEMVTPPPGLGGFGWN